jgi:ferric-dicitrate binding protein FerR (iron transport regulator)
MTKKEKLEYLLYEFLYGKLGGHDKKLINEWISANSENKKEFERCKRIFEEQKRYIPDSDVIVSREKIKTALLYKFFKTKKRDRFVISGLATSLVICGLFIGFYSESFGGSNNIYHTGTTVVKTESDERSSCVLSDGTKIWLNHDSEIKYRFLSEGLKKIREVKVQGEVYFDVAKQRKIPFEVITENTRIKVYGTQFNVKQKKDRNLQVTLVEGSMAVFTKEEDIKIFQLEPGDQVVLSRQGELLLKREVDIKQAALWKEGRYEFKDVTLKDIVDHLNEIYSVNIRFKHNKLKDEHFRCVIDRHKSLLQTLEILKETTNLSYSIKGPDIVLIQN